MMDIANVDGTWTDEELTAVKRLQEVNDQLKVLEMEKQALVCQVKNAMITHQVSSFIMNNHQYDLAYSESRAVKRKDKDEFIASLINQGKSYLAHMSLDLDLDGIFAEVDAGLLDKDFVNKYVKVTPKTSLHCR